MADVLRAGGRPQGEVQTAAVGAWALVHGLAMLRLDLPPGAIGGDEADFLARVQEITAAYGRGLLAPPVSAPKKAKT